MPSEVAPPTPQDAPSSHTTSGPRPGAVTAEDVDVAVRFAVDTLRGAPEDAWHRRAGALAWNCRETADHLSTALFLYAAQLAPRRPATDTAAPLARTPRRPGLATVLAADAGADGDGVLAIVETAGALLSAQLRVRTPDVRAWHRSGVCDPEGFAAMGVVESLVHGHDIAEGLGLDWAPPADVCARALGRLFPDVAVRDADGPWPTLLWATGRAALPDRPRRADDWSWHGPPLDGGSAPAAAGGPVTGGE